MKQLDAGELPLQKVFCSDFDFSIPDYQRPYAWGKEQALQLLDDLEDGLSRATDEPYFLGSIVLVKDKGVPRAEVIDGQQRLTTLMILFAVLRDLAAGQQLAAELGDFIREPGKILAGTKEKPRLTLRSRDAAFFQEHVQVPGKINTLASLESHALKTDAQKAIRDNAAALQDVLSTWADAKRQDLAAMLGARTYLVVVSTPDLTSAHRIFSVMNARGLDLTPSDIFKAQVVGSIATEEQPTYADRWEDAEEDLGREAFADLFLHIRMIFAKERAKKVLLLEFKEQVLNQYLPTSAVAFVDDVLLPYSQSYEHLLNQDYLSPGWSKVNLWLKRLMQLDNSDWRPPALWALRHHGDDPQFLKVFLRRLERLAASMLLRRLYATPRSSRYAELLQQLDAGDGLEAAAFTLSRTELKDTRDRLDDELYRVQSVRKYVLLRLDESLAKAPGVSYDHRIITVEHVLPQHPAQDSTWVKDFSEEERDHWTHRLANLVLLNRAKNSEAQNFEFENKKHRYFTGPNGVATFALTSQVIGAKAWTPATLEARQEKLLEILNKEWSLDGSQ